MKKPRILIASLLLTSVFMGTVKAEPEYNVDSKVLTIPVVKIGGSHVYDATLKLNDAGSFDIDGYSETPPSGSGVDAKCTEDKITPEKYNQIVDGMTLEEVNNILGCTGESRSEVDSVSGYHWEGESRHPSIRIHFVSDVVYMKEFTP